MAPRYVILVLIYLELKLYVHFEQIFGPKRNTLLKMSFVDDVFCLWDNDKLGQVTILFVIINDLDPNIKFTVERNNSQVHVVFW